MFLTIFLLQTVLNYDFKVYTVGWYVEAQGARKDPYLRTFEGLSSNELATSNDFYDAMTRKESLYDRTIFIKLAMALQTDLMIRGLVEELQISAKNSVRSSICLGYYLSYCKYMFYLLSVYLFVCLSFYFVLLSACLHVSLFCLLTLLSICLFCCFKFLVVLSLFLFVFTK